jgi:MFS superfamily sulfate permease-like transporter
VSESRSTQANPTVLQTPVGNKAGFFKHFRYDFTSGFLVFLIALPLCLGISLASGFPAIAGVFTAIAGAGLTVFFSNSELTIKGPAAGLIVIVVGAVTDFGYTAGVDADADFRAYRMALAVGVVSGLIQIIFGIVRAGVLGDFFPTAVVHGMLAAIGVIIVLKQLPVAVGQSAKGEPLEILRELPETMLNANPDIAIIGLVSLAILFGFGYWKRRTKSAFIKAAPAQLIVLVVAIPMGIFFNLTKEHSYTFLGYPYQLGERFLVSVPNNLIAAMAFPDFSVFSDPAHAWGAVKWVVMFSLIGSLESMLSAKAIDMIDPWKRKTNLNRDLIAVGIANTAVATIGGLPMISEIVRSKANIDNGARTRFANFWHGVLLLAFVALLPSLIHRVPLAALAAMLVYTGFRLASPVEFINVYKTGREQLIIFVTTLVAVLATDLLVGIAIGILVKLSIHLFNGLPISSILMPYLEITEQGENTVLINAKGSAVFSNLIPFRRQIEQVGLIGRNNVIVDLSAAKLVDSSVMEKLHELQLDFEQNRLTLEIRGLEGHRQLSSHPFSTRKRGLTALRRITVIVEEQLEQQIVDRAIELGASGYTAMSCRGLGRSGLSQAERRPQPQVRIEIIVNSTIAEQILDYISEFIEPFHHVSVCSETVEVNFHAKY